MVTPFFNTTRESVFVHYSHPNFPDFRMKAGFHLTDDFITVYPIQNSTVVKNSYEYVFKGTVQFLVSQIFIFADLIEISQNSPSLIKLSYEVYNFPWLGPKDVITGPNNNASYFTIWFENNGTIQI